MAKDATALQQALNSVNALLDKQHSIDEEIHMLKKKGATPRALEERTVALAQVAATIRIVVSHLEAAKDSQLLVI